MTKRLPITESVKFSSPVPKITTALESAVSDTERPLVIFPEIHAITGNWVTRNKTYYPNESLIGTPNKGTGAISFYYPYPTPILRDHLSSPDVMGANPASLPYGRVYSANFIHEAKTGGGWLREIPAITDPFAIEAILTGRFLTVSIGIETESVHCSVCGNNLVEDFCDHRKGEVYDGKECYWKMGEIIARETSFVNVPSDVNAGILNPSMDIGEIRLMLAGPGIDYLIDLATGGQVPTENYRDRTLGISKRSYKEILESAEESRELYKVGTEQELPDFTKVLLENENYRQALRRNVKGL